MALFLEDWELGRVALRCHMAVDLLWDACWVSSESLSSPRSLCSQCWEDSLADDWEGWESGKSTVTARKACLSPWTVRERKERDVVREINEKEEG